MLKSIGTAARARVEKMLGRKVHLKLWVRTTPDWMNDPAKLRELGYGAAVRHDQASSLPASAASLPAGVGTMPIVAIVGRPNVGKSTLFNRLARARLAIVHDEPGVTRDRNYADTTAFGRRYTLVDTGGFDPEDEDPMKAGIAQHVRAAVAEADVIVFVTDATTRPERRRPRGHQAAARRAASPSSTPPTRPTPRRATPRPSSSTAWASTRCTR